MTPRCIWRDATFVASSAMPSRKAKGQTAKTKTPQLQLAGLWRLPFDLASACLSQSLKSRIASTGARLATFADVGGVATQEAVADHLSVGRAGRR